MLRRSSLVLLALALGLFMAACGSDDKSDTTEVNETQVDSAALVLPAHAVAAKDGARSHSDSDVYECSSTDLEGDVGSAAFGGFQDISVRASAARPVASGSSRSTTRTRTARSPRASTATTAR